MKKIVYLPLDERPCNANFAPDLFRGEKFQVVRPEKLGLKKIPADWEVLKAFLLNECADADGAVLSMDMLLYGGLIPSRLHHLDRETVEERMALLGQIKKANPSLQIYAFQCIMRCPKYSSSDEEPDYYEDYGHEIHFAGNAQHRFQLGLCSEEEMKAEVAKVPAEILQDYLDRRAFNLSFNQKVLELLRDGVIDFLIIPQDDSAPYGYTAVDQQKVRAKIAEERLGARVLVYPGADELGLTLMSRMTLHFEGLRPRVYIKYAATNAPQVIPLYEDRPLGESIKYQITAAGCRIATSLSEADFVLALSCPAAPMREAAAQPVLELNYTVERTLVEFVLFMQDCIADGKIVTLGDNAYANGGDLELIAMLDQMGMLDKLHGYSGWNTSANTVGTAIAEGVHALIEGITPAHRDFMALRYVEDAGYCGTVRGFVVDNELPQIGLNYFDAREQRGEVSRIVKHHLNAFIQNQLPSIADQISIEDIWMPWSRMFEVGLKVRWN